jgi:hypothetical protein
MLNVGAFFLACDAVGVNRTTAWGWLEKGRKGIEPYDEFAALVGKSRAEVAGKLMFQAQTDKGGPAFLLERLFPSEFGLKAKAGQDAMELLMDQVLPRISQSAQQEVLDALAAVRRERSGEPGVADSEAAGVGAEAVIDVDGEPVEGETTSTPQALPSHTDDEAG